MSKILFKNIGARGSFDAKMKPEYSAIVPFSVPKYVDWLPQNSTQPADFFFYFDEMIRYGLSCPGLKYGYLFESRPYLQGNLYWGWIIDDILNNINLYKSHYKYIFTCWKDLVEMGPPFAYRIGGGSKLQNSEKSMYNKNKLVSMFVSNSNVLPGHQKRLEYMNKYKHAVDLYGRGHNYISDANYIMAYKDYMFVIAFDNCNVDWQFSEKLLDPILTGAIPIYYGSKDSVHKYFDDRGILFAEDINPETDLTPELYESMLPYAKINFDIAYNLPTIEDHIYETYLRG